MIFFSKNGLTDKAGDAVATLEAPIFVSNGKEMRFAKRGDGS